MIPSAAGRYWRSSDPFCSDRVAGATAATAEIANAFEWPGKPTKLPLPVGIGSPI